MRSLALLLPLVVLGCAPGRQASVSSDGRVASTARGGTFVSGRGRVAVEGADLAWSPDGSALAIATKDGTLLWPGDTRIPTMGDKLAWSPDGKSLAGVVANNVAVWDAATGKLRETQTVGIPTIGIRWMPDGRILEVDDSGFQVEGFPRVVRGTDKSTLGSVLDAAPQSDGSVVWLEFGEPKKASGYLAAPLSRGRWDPATRQITLAKVAILGKLLGADSTRRLTVPTQFALSPDGGSYAVGGLALEAGARTLARLKALADKDASTAKGSEFDRLLKAARKRSVVVRIDPSGRATPLWSETVPTEDAVPTDLAWSPDGRWLAIARKDGTVRVATGE